METKGSIAVKSLLPIENNTIIEEPECANDTKWTKKSNL